MQLRKLITDYNPEVEGMYQISQGMDIRCQDIRNAVDRCLIGRNLDLCETFTNRLRICQRMESEKVLYQCQPTLAGMLNALRDPKALSSDKLFTISSFRNCMSVKNQWSIPQTTTPNFKKLRGHPDGITYKPRTDSNS